MLVVGAKEAEARLVAYRDRIDGDQGALPLADALARLRAESDARTIRQTVAPSAPEPVTPESEGEKHAY